MQSSKIEFLSKYNDLLNIALKSQQDFPDIISDYLVSEYELEAVTIFKIADNLTLSVLGRSSSAKKSFIKNANFECNNCFCIKSAADFNQINMQSDCEIQITDYMIYEVCIKFKYSNNTALIKIAKKTPFTNIDRDQIRMVSFALGNIFTIWAGNEKKESNLSSIIIDIASELRTPTNSIMGFISLLNEDNLSSSQAEYVSTMKENAHYLLALMNDLIDLAKFDSGQIKESPATINLKNFVGDIVKTFTDKIDQNKIEILTNFDKILPETVKLDSQKLKYILINIIANSLRLTERGKITISISSSIPGRINFRISDTSAGLSSNKVKEFFKPFSITDLSNNKTGNATGLGLALSKLYIEFLNGNIDISSSLGKGTSYNFTIKVDDLPIIESTITSLPKPGKKNRVLVVEDDYATSKLLSNYLNKWGYEPVIVNSADQALKAIEKEVFLAVLMDIVLPDANGFELLKQIREHKNSKNTPVIVCSVEAEQQKAFLMGAVEYFVKPIKYKFLVEVLTSYRLKKDSNILVVDDDVPTLSLIKEAIIQAGYNAIAESHSAKVYSMIEDMHLDLAIIDLDMPELNGYDLIKQIKSDPKFSKLPIIIYTGKENYKDDLKKIDGLFTELLQKSSSNIEDLSDTINQMINRYDEPTPPEVVAAQKDGVKILLVEDYKHSQIIVTRLLKKNNFDSIVVVENGAEAVDQVKKQKFDLILMDMQMPIMNGFEATEKIRLMPEYKDTPIIALTAFAMKGDREKCLDAGATDYIPKPIDSQEFIQKVKYYTELKVSIS
ncbi:MAG: response regulator [Ignavibacteriaceae bacterium]|nr:response regulator [Ignavibacteriaceae bacterium]